VLIKSHHIIICHNKILKSTLEVQTLLKHLCDVLQLAVSFCKAYLATHYTDCAKAYLATHYTDCAKAYLATHYTDCAKAYLATHYTDCAKAYLATHYTDCAKALCTHKMPFILHA
jgi:hypothetical protein